MSSILRIRTKILPGKRIEISAPELLEGELVDVLVMAPAHDSSKQQSALSVLQGLEGPRLFKTAEEADRYLQEERDSWDR